MRFTRRMFGCRIGTLDILASNPGILATLGHDVGASGLPYVPPNCQRIGGHGCVLGAARRTNPGDPVPESAQKGAASNRYEASQAAPASPINGQASVLSEFEVDR